MLRYRMNRKTQREENRKKKAHISKNIEGEDNISIHNRSGIMQLSTPDRRCARYIGSHPRNMFQASYRPENMVGDFHCTEIIPFDLQDVIDKLNVKNVDDRTHRATH